MGNVLHFPVRFHARASSTCFAAKRAKRSAVTPADLAVSVARTRVHHSDGITSRLNHLITDQLVVPTSDAIASREAHKSMIDLNEVSGCESVAVMHQVLGPFVPKCKAVLSHDLKNGAGHYVPMSKEAEKLAESDWRSAFQERVRYCQGKRSQDVMADLLGISRDSWNKIVNRGDQPSIRLLPKIAGIGEVSLEWLIDGKEPAKAKKPARATPVSKRA